MTLVPNSPNFPALPARVGASNPLHRRQGEILQKDLRQKNVDSQLGNFMFLPKIFLQPTPKAPSKSPTLWHFGGIPTVAMDVDPDKISSKNV